LEVRQLAIGRLKDPAILEVKLFRDIDDPVAAEALPREHIDATRPEQPPQRHFHGAGIGAGHDRDPIVGGNLQHLSSQVDDLPELRLAFLRAVRSAECGPVERL
jgi:hypothetical protein